MESDAHPLSPTVCRPSTPRPVTVRSSRGNSAFSVWPGKCQALKNVCRTSLAGPSQGHVRKHVLPQQQAPHCLRRYHGQLPLGRYCKLMTRAGAGDHSGVVRRTGVGESCCPGPLRLQIAPTPKQAPEKSRRLSTKVPQVFISVGFNHICCRLIK